jgi:hypothetical protein
MSWDRYFPKNLGSPCSIYLNFYNPIGCQTCFNQEMFGWWITNSNGAYDSATTLPTIRGYYNEMLDNIDLFDGGKGKYINIAYKNMFDSPSTQTSRISVSDPYSFPNAKIGASNTVITNACDPVAAYHDGKNTKGTGSPIGDLAEGQGADICRENSQTFDCNSVFFGTGTSYPNISSDANSSYYKVSIPHDGYFNDEREDNTNSDGGGVKKSLFKYINSFSTLQ